jgi:hypothetical protein
MFCKSMLVLALACPARVSDVDDYNAALPFFASWSNGRSLCATRRIERKLDSRTFTLPTEVFFSAQNFFDDPGVQHGSSFAPRSLRILAL